MRSSTDDDIKRSFDLISLRREAAKMLTGREWSEFQKIKKAYEDKRRFEQRAYELEYDTRVEVVRERLINQAGEKNLDFKHRWFSHDRFDKSAINRQAHRWVQDQHQRRLAHLEAREIKDIDKLLNCCERRRKLREKPRRDFDRATDRRSGKERRVRTRQRER